MTPNFVDGVKVLMPICCHNGSDMLNLCIFVEDIFSLLSAKTDRWVRKLNCLWLKVELINDQVEFARKIINAKFIVLTFQLRGFRILAWYCILTNDL